MFSELKTLYCSTDLMIFEHQQIPYKNQDMYTIAYTCITGYSRFRLKLLIHACCKAFLIPLSSVNLSIFFSGARFHNRFKSPRVSQKKEQLLDWSESLHIKQKRKKRHFDRRATDSLAGACRTHAHTLVWLHACFLCVIREKGGARNWSPLILSHLHEQEVDQEEKMTLPLSRSLNFSRQRNFGCHSQANFLSNNSLQCVYAYLFISYYYSVKHDNVYVL